MTSFHYLFVVPVIVSGSILYGLATNALPVTTQNINIYYSGFPWQLSRLNGEETLHDNPQNRHDPNTLLWPYRVDLRMRGDDSIIYILDSGVRSSHDSFRDYRKDRKTRVEDGGTFKDATGPATTDIDGHGTHIASMAASGTRYGVATLATIVSYKVVDYVEEYVPTDSLIAGIKVAMDNFKQKNPKIGVINISMGTMPLLEFRGKEFQKAVEDALSIGMHVTLAAGNQGTNDCGPDYVEGDWIYVGATDVSDNIAGYSNYGACVDIYAPGNNVVVARHDNDVEYTFVEGTSLAAPLVAGVIASIGASDPKLARNPKEMKKYILKKSAIGKIRNLLDGSFNRILQLPILDY